MKHNLLNKKKQTKIKNQGMIIKKLMTIAYLYSTSSLADGGCTSIKDPACLFWTSILIFGSGLLFWLVFLPIFFTLNFLIKLKKTYYLIFLILSYFFICCLELILSADRYKYFRYGTILEKYKDYEFWIISITVYLLLDWTPFESTDC